MSIEQKIAQILAESNPASKDAVAGDQTPVHKSSTAISRSSEEKPAGSGNEGGDKSEIRKGDAVPAQGETANPDNARNNVKDEKEAEGGTSEKSNPATAKAASGDQAVIRKGTTVKEDMDALFNGEELTEDFKTKATTIFEAAVMARVHAEVARIEEEFESKIAEAVAKNTEGIVEQVDGYLGYIAEQWMTQNELALERGIKTEILESFVSGMKTVFEEHYIDIPEEKYDLVGSLEEQVEELEAKLNEQLAANVELSKNIAEATRSEIVKTIAEGLTDIESEKFNALVEELSYEDATSFETKVKTIRENYFTKKTTEVQSVVTDAPVLTEEVKAQVQADPAMSAYVSVLNKLK